MIERGSYVIRHPEGWIDLPDYPPGAGIGVGLVTAKIRENAHLVQWPMGGQSQHFNSELIQTSLDGTPVAYHPFAVDSIVKVSLPFHVPGYPGETTNSTEATGVIKGVKGTGPGTVFSVQLHSGPLLDCNPDWISQFILKSRESPKLWSDASPTPPGMEPCPEPKPTESELKEAAHLKLSSWDIKPGYAFEHYKGGVYDVVAVSIMEDTLEPLVTYQSRKLGSYTTRTVKQFLGRVVYQDRGCTVGRPRFMRASHHDKPTEGGSFAVVNQNQYPRKFTMLHPQESKAREEAERLARKCPGDKFGVFKCIGDVKALPAPVDWTDPVTGEVLERKEAKVYVDPFGGPSRSVAPTGSGPYPEDSEDWLTDRDGD